MLRRWTTIGAAMALWAGSCPAPALAQSVFFDDFDGPDLLPHWSAPPPENWEYSVSGGMLNVTDLHFPGIPHLESNFATMSASFQHQADFRVDAWMGWDNPPAERYDELRLMVIGPSGGIMADFGLFSAGGPAEIIAVSTAGGGAVRRPPPPPGLYQFTIARTGSRFDFYLDGDHFASLPDTGEVTPAAEVQFFLSKPFPGEMNPYHIDRVSVVPAPGVIVIGTLLTISCVRRRR